MTLNEYCIKAMKYGLDVHSRENMLNSAKYNIDEDNLNLAIHILNGVNETYAEYYAYDYSMGTLESITPIEDLEDIINLYGNDWLKD